MSKNSVDTSNGGFKFMTQVMDRDNLRKLDENFDAIGHLTREQFLAVKNLSKPVYIVDRNTKLIKKDMDGFKYRTDPEMVQLNRYVGVRGFAKRAGNEIKMPLMVSTKEVMDAWADRETDDFIIEDDKRIVTTLDISGDCKALEIMFQQNPELEDVLKDIITQDVTYREFETIYDLRQQGLQVDVNSIEIEMEQKYAMACELTDEEKERIDWESEPSPSYDL